MTEPDYLSTFWSPMLGVLPVLLLAVVLEARATFTHIRALAAAEHRNTLNRSARRVIKLTFRIFSFGAATLSLAFVMTAVVLAKGDEPGLLWRGIVLSLTIPNLVFIVLSPLLLERLLAIFSTSGPSFRGNVDQT